jgi:hypothetical protein
MKYVALLLCCVACGGAPQSDLLEGRSTFEIASFDDAGAYVVPPLSQWADAGDEYPLPGDCTSDEQGCGDLWCYYTFEGCGSPKQTPNPPNGGGGGSGGPVPYR